jgi:hypothetical protein
MILRRAIRFGLAGALGVSCALLASCGSSKGLIPSSNAGPLSGDFDNVTQAVAQGDCAATRQALAQARHDFDALPATVDAGLRSRLREGLTNLDSVALTQCAQTQSQSQSTATTAPTTTQTTSTTTTTPPPTTSTTTTTAPPTTSTGGTGTTDTTTTPTTGTNGGTPGPASGGGTGVGGGGGNGAAGGGNG